MERIHTKLWILLQFSSGLHGTKEQRNKKVKSQYHMFSTMEIEEDIESELSGIFRVKLVAKNIAELSLHCDASF